MFATIVIVLPSEFTGGEAHLTHSGLTTKIDCSPDSLLSTTALSWYTDVTHEIKPITSGYRLALSYNLIHTTNTLRPSLPSADGVVTKLRHILLSWKQQADFDPLMIIHLLEHKYSLNLSGSALKGKDAHKVAILQALGQQHGFRLGLAQLQVYTRGQAEHHRRSRSERLERCYYDDYDEDEDEDDDDDESDPDPFDLDADVEETTWTVENMVDLQGEVIADEINNEVLEHNVETIPINLQDRVESGEPDEAEYEGHQGDVSDDLYALIKAQSLICMFPAARGRS